jgi:hypothetical protein
VTTAPDGDEEVVGTREIYRAYHVGDAAAAGYQAGRAVDHAVPDLSRRFVATIVGTEQGAAQIAREFFDGLLSNY